MIVRTFYYDEEFNVLIDEQGEPFFDMFRFIPPWLYQRYKEVRGTYYHEIKEENVTYEFVFELYEDDERW